MLIKLAPFALALFTGAMVLYCQNPTLAVWFAAMGQVCGFGMAIPQIVTLYQRKTADDIDLNTSLLTCVMIVALGVQAVVTCAHWLIIVNFSVSLLSCLILATQVAYYQSREVSPNAKR